MIEIIVIGGLWFGFDLDREEDADSLADTVRNPAPITLRSKDLS